MTQPREYTPMAVLKRGAVDCHLPDDVPPWEVSQPPPTWFSRCFFLQRIADHLDIRNDLKDAEDTRMHLSRCSRHVAPSIPMINRLPRPSEYGLVWLVVLGPKPKKRHCAMWYSLCSGHRATAPSQCQNYYTFTAVPGDHPSRQQDLVVTQPHRGRTGTVPGW